MIRQTIAAAIVIAASSVSAGLLSAQLVSTGLPCSASGALTFMGATSCLGAFDGNNKGNADLNALVASKILEFGAGAMEFRGSSDDAGSFGPFTGNPNTLRFGTLTFDDRVVGPFVLAIKASNEFSLYYFLNTGAGVPSVPFTTVGVKAGGAELSHASLYVGRLNVVPEPSTYALMATGLAGIVGIARRRRQA